jgi:predicted AlkP superfamily pyrophosphatase or phosphodiesterase
VARGARPFGAAALCLLGAFGCGGAASSPTAPPTPAVVATPPPPPRVLIVSVDGLRPDAIFAIATPTLRDLIARGSSTMGAQTINPSNTLPSHTSMLTGVTPAVHRITWDEYLPQNGRLTAPTVFSAARLAGKTSALVAGKQKFLTFRDTAGLDASVITDLGDAEVANRAILQLEAGFDLVFVHMGDVDLRGHEKAWMSADYLERVSQADAAIGRILRSVPPNMTVIVTADHGGSQNGHGTTAAIHMTIPWIVVGPGVKAGNQLSVRVNTYDTAVTAAFVLGFRMPDVNGRVVSEAFAAATTSLP